MKYLLLLEDGSLRQSDDEPDEDTLAEIEQGTLDVIKQEDGVYLYAEVETEEGEEEEDTTFRLKGWKVVQEA